MRRLCVTLTLLILAFIRVDAQEEGRQKAETKQAYNLPAPQTSEGRPRLWQWDDGLLIVSFVADEVSTHSSLGTCAGCKEAGLFRNTGLRLGGKAAVFALVKWYEAKHPEDRQRAKWMKVVVAAALTAVAVHNFKITR